MSQRSEFERLLYKHEPKVTRLASRRKRGLRRLPWRWRLAGLKPKLGLAVAIAALSYGLTDGFRYIPILHDSATYSGNGRVLTGRTTHVRDGDTIEVAGRPIRLAKLDCAELGTAQGAVAKRRMRALVERKVMTCHLTSRRSYDRIVGTCYLPDGRDIDQIMLSEGVCRRFW